MKRIADPRLAAIWKATHRDFKGVFEGSRQILVLRAGGTCSVPLESLTEAEIADKLPKGWST